MNRSALAVATVTVFTVCPLFAQQQRQGPRYPVNPKALAAGYPGFAAPDRVIGPAIQDYAGVPTIAGAVQDSDLVVAGTVQSVAWRPGPPPDNDPIAVVTFRSAIPLQRKPGLALKAPLVLRAGGGVAVVRGQCVFDADTGAWIEPGRNYLVFAYVASDTHDLWTGAWYAIGPDGVLRSPVDSAATAFLDGKPAAQVEAKIRAEVLREAKK